MTHPRKDRQHPCRVALAGLLLLALSEPGSALATGHGRALAENHSVTTVCAEHDNVSVPVFVPGSTGNIASFSIEARQPDYEFVHDWTDENFDNCPPPTHEDTFYANPGHYVIYDDGTTVVVAVRNDRWWRPVAMTASAQQTRLPDIHYIAVHREIDGRYPQVLVFYTDGNLRLKPLPPPNRRDTVFGSSVVVGPAPVSDRPHVLVDSIRYRPRSDSFEVTYEGGASATISFEETTRRVTRIRVDADFPDEPEVAFATFRSMYVAEGNTDVDRVRWKTDDGQLQERHVMDFTSALSSGFLFRRERVSIHNTSAPDIWIGAFELAGQDPEFLRGDTDGSGSLGLTDAILVLEFLYLGGEPVSCADAADANDNGRIELSDAVTVLNHLFLGGTPVINVDRCAADPTEDGLDCTAQPSEC